MRAIFCFLSGFFFLGFTLAFSGGSGDSVPLSLRFGGSFSGFAIRFTLRRFDPGVFCCKAVGFGFFSSSTFAFCLGGIGFVYTALALGFFVCFTLGLGGRSADAFSLGFRFASGSGLGRFKLSPGSFFGTASFFYTYAFGFGSFSSSRAFGCGSFFSGTSPLFCFTGSTLRLFAGTAGFFFSGGLGFCFRFFAGSTLRLFRFTASFGSGLFSGSALFILAPRFFFGYAFAFCFGPGFFFCPLTFFFCFGSGFSFNSFAFFFSRSVGSSFTFTFFFSRSFSS